MLVITTFDKRYQTISVSKNHPVDFKISDSHLRLQVPCTVTPLTAVLTSPLPLVIKRFVTSQSNVTNF